jgi:hypothetical protein
MRSTLHARWLPTFVFGAVLVGGGGAAAAAAETAAGPASSAIGTCTIGVDERRATIEVRVVNAADFCELMSQVLAVAVFRSPIVVTPGWLWHYTDSDLSCQLRYRRSQYRMVVRNSPHACRWLIRRATGWNAELQPQDGGRVRERRS